LELFIKIAFPSQFAAQLTNLGLLVRQNKRAQGFLHNFAPVLIPVNC
jgi:hypothetical protein